MFDYFSVNLLKIEEAGDCDLDGFFIRLNHAIDVVTADRGSWQHRITIFMLRQPSQSSCELYRLFRWLKHNSVRVIITGERAETTSTRQGL